MACASDAYFMGTSHASERVPRRSGRGEVSCSGKRLPFMYAGPRLTTSARIVMTFRSTSAQSDGGIAHLASSSITRAAKPSGTSCCAMRATSECERLHPTYPTLCKCASNNRNGSSGRSLHSRALGGRDITIEQDSTQPPSAATLSSLKRRKRSSRPRMWITIGTTPEHDIAFTLPPPPRITITRNYTVPGGLDYAFFPLVFIVGLNRKRFIERPTMGSQANLDTDKRQCQFLTKKMITNRSCNN